MSLFALSISQTQPLTPSSVKMESMRMERSTLMRIRMSLMWEPSWLSSISKRTPQISKSASCVPSLPTRTRPVRIRTWLPLRWTSYGRMVQSTMELSLTQFPRILALSSSTLLSCPSQCLSLNHLNSQAPLHLLKRNKIEEVLLRAKRHLEVSHRLRALTPSSVYYSSSGLSFISFDIRFFHLILYIN